MGDEIMGPNNSTSSTNEDIYKARGKRRKLLISELVLDYSNNTTLHGIPYATKRVLTMVEKFLFMGFWMITTIISMILCSIVIYQLWERWRTSPVIVTINEHMVSVATVPLPSIIICPQKKINTNKYNYTHEYNELSQFKDETLLNSSTIERINKFNDINQVCGDYRKELPIRSRDYTDGSIVDHILDVSLDVDNVFMYCLSINKSDLKCKGLFAKVITPEGVCFTMNTLAHEEIFRSKSILHPSKRLNTEKRSKGWSMAQGYTDSTSDSYPIRGTEDSGVPDLSFFLYNVESDNEYRCNYITSGYRIYLSHPTDMPQSSKYYYPIDNSKHTALALSFNVLNTSESLRTYSVEDRQCYFPKDRYLRYFNIYTANNCWIECLANYTYQYCNCTAYDMPHNGSGQICAEVKLLCVRQIREKLVLYKDARSLGCNCLPACVSVDYEADILKTELNFDSSTLGDESFKTIKYTRLDVFYKKPRYLSMRRSELFAMTEFLADCGGVLGLFLGFSFLSIVELLYYFTLRLMCILKKDLEEEKAKVVKTVQNERF